MAGRPAESSQDRQRRAAAELIQQCLTSDDLSLLIERAREIVCDVLAVAECEVERMVVGESGPEVLRNEESGSMPSEPVVCDDLREEDGAASRQGRAGRDRASAAWIPIPAPGGAYGVLAAYDPRPGRFGEGELDFLRAVSRILSQAIGFRRSAEHEYIGRVMLRAIIHEMPALVWTTDSDLRIQHVLGAGLARFARYEGFLGKTLFEFFGTGEPDFPPLAAHRRALRGETGSYGYEIDEMVFESKVEPLRDAAGRTIGCIGVALDVTERERAKKGLALLGTALESADNAVLIVDRQGRIRWVNPAFSVLTGYSPAEAIGQTPRLLKSGVHDRSFYQNLWTTIGSGRVWRGETVNRKKDGTTYTEEQTITPVRDGKGEISHFIAIKQDITEKRKLEDQFRQAQKMEAVGRLAGGVAHDFNNLLTVILGYSDLLALKMPEYDPRQSDLDGIRKAGERAASLIRQLLAFSRRQVLQPRVIDLNEVIRNLEKMLHRLIGEDVELSAALAGDLWMVRADPGQIEQVIMNLAVNARDAMPRGGKLTIETANVEPDEEYLRRHSVVRRGAYVRLSITDTGSGMDEETLAHIFEPFFTTKEAGKGTGLGLSTVYGIVKQSGGYIWTYSEPGRGTTFKIYLPRTGGGAEPRVEKTAKARPARGSETILVVEDDAGVRGVARQILRDGGYSVLEARNGMDALLVSSEHQGQIHLLITDVVMPLMSGRELASRQSALRPEMKVIYVSGYSDEAVVRHGFLDSGVPFLSKPFASASLLSKVREVLDVA